jgi:hypothetical protein
MHYVKYVDTTKTNNERNDKQLLKQSNQFKSNDLVKISRY